MDDQKIKFLTGVIDRIEGEKAVVRLDDGQEIVWPKDKLTSDIKEGSSVKIIALGDNEMEAHREEIAKNILKEIFKTDD
ncbi:MAG: DUF3006 domain-containing protein [Candidatus Buchananbacteria bacterium]